MIFLDNWSKVKALKVEKGGTNIAGGMPSNEK
jgi:hypothetical protein